MTTNTATAHHPVKTSPSYAITATGLRKAYGEQVVLDGTDLAVAQEVTPASRTRCTDLLGRAAHHAGERAGAHQGRVAGTRAARSAETGSAARSSAELSPRASRPRRAPARRCGRRPGPPGNSRRWRAGRRSCPPVLAQREAVAGGGVGDQLGAGLGTGP
ncbi:hypothetical protein [Streptomyces sp. R41]|uniref:Uncharacterized protein n=1 Tax=Streptomyces sp. R41 TaxID=3238632 RepID=A0AB39RPI4_9ACTN